VAVQTDFGSWSVFARVTNARTRIRDPEFAAGGSTLDREREHSSRIFGDIKKSSTFDGEP